MAGDSQRIYEFYYNLYVGRRLPDAFESVCYRGREFRPGEGENAPEVPGKARIAKTALITHCPSYLDYTPNPRPAQSCKKLFRVRGFAMDLTGVDSAREYLGKYLNSGFRTSLRRRLRGLENSLELRHEVFFGHLEDGVYLELMRDMEQMLTRRFNQRNEEHMSLSNWAYFKDRTLELVREKKASISVIYDAEKPIQICLNYHLDSVVFLAIPAYDIDYSKYGLGIIGVYKVLEWGLRNGVTKIDMGFGALDYKLRWCNTSYAFRHYLFYEKNSPASRFFAVKHILKTRVVVFLLDRKINLLWRRFRNLWRRKPPPELPAYRVTRITGQEDRVAGRPQVYPFSDPDYAFLKHALLNFAYRERVRRTAIRVFPTRREKEYLFDSGKNRILVCL
ncbi:MULTISPECIES: GNAT family N-acetyltransferase [unclassified Robiginitalea]|uniref:GNAT family N-acetyltransferase n=1 Tax=Robiginitalea TaxID=252306 RepID=UPI00234915C5|nr:MULTISPECIES: GNAT family N-acetyltransferase [unclassified Robiginitalea]MDC6353809.1 GNAT family N-acetyltransferase [Robiginitalea sp. PM2]MDC6374076.1 GNAT family N-acetyltransferase [Robiginitalea sp. SP8]